MMKVRKIVFITVVCLSFAILTANADTTTDLLFGMMEVLNPHGMFIDKMSLFLQLMWS